MLYYGCYFPRLVTERGLGVARIISFFNSIYHSRYNLSLHLQVAR